MALKGNLRDFSTTQLLNLINLARKTGTLTIDVTDAQSRVCFKEGKLVYATQEKQGGHLATMLQQAGKLSEDEARKIRSQKGIKNDRDLGMLLIKSRRVSEDDIKQSVQTYILNNVYPLFTWSDGTFRFEASVLPFEDRITIPINLENVIMEGSRRMQEWERLQDELPDLDIALRFVERPDARMRDINMSVEEWRVVSFINPRNTVRQIAQFNNMSDFQIRKIVYALLQAGLVELIVPEGMSKPDTSAAMRPPAIKRGVVEKLIGFFQQRQ